MALQKLSVSILLLGVLVSLGTCDGIGRTRRGHRNTCRPKPMERPAGVDPSVDYENLDRVTAVENGRLVVYCARGCCGYDCCSDMNPWNGRHDGDSHDRDDWGDDWDDDDDREGEEALRVIVPVVISVGVLAVIIAVIVCVIRRKKRASIVNTDASKGPIAEAGMYPSGKQPLPDYPGDSKMPDATFVTGVPPPAYDVINVGGDAATAPPTYSSLNLQEAAKDSAPAPEDKAKKVPIA